MTEPSTPKLIELLAAGYVVGNLSSQELAEFEQLLADHPELTQEVEQLQTTCDRLLIGLHEVPPPPSLWHTIQATIYRSMQFAPASRRWFLRWQPVLGSIAVLLILGLGVDNYRLRQDLLVAHDIHMLLQDSNTQLFTLQHVSPTNTASGRFVVNLDQQKGILIVQHLTTPPDGYTYRLWTVMGNDEIPCGEVNIPRNGAVFQQFLMPADLYDNKISGLVMTLEPSQLNRYPLGAVVMKSTI